MPHNDDLLMLRNAAQAWISEQATVSRFRRLRDADGIVRDHEAWRDMAGMGWTGVAIAEEFGGAGLGVAAAAILLEEGGRTLVATPLLGGALAAALAVLRIGSAEQKARWLPRIARGETTVIFALDARSPERVLPEAVMVEGSYRLTGKIALSPDVAMADWLIVPARLVGDGPEPAIVFLIVDAALVARDPRILVDRRDYARLDFDGLRLDMRALIGPPQQIGALDAIFDRICIGLAAEMLGSAEQAFDITIDYLRTREQFGRKIGSFQALQHRAAQMLCELETLRAVVEAASAAADADDADLPALASMAKALAGETLHRVSSEAVQMHGGIGMTDEHDIGLYLKRARVMESLFGSSAWHRGRYATYRGF